MGRAWGGTGPQKMGGGFTLELCGRREGWQPCAVRAWGSWIWEGVCWGELPCLASLICCLFKQWGS